MGQLWGHSLARLLCLLAMGCSSADDRRTKAGPPVHPVKGRVVLDGKPLTAAMVNFYEPTSARTAYGKTDDHGEFVLTTFKRDDGAVAGTHQVKVMKYEVVLRAKPGVDASRSAVVPPAPETHWQIPEAYGDYGRSGLSAEVRQDQKNELIIELRTRGPSR